MWQISDAFLHQSDDDLGFSVFRLNFRNAGILSSTHLHAFYISCQELVEHFAHN